MAGGAVEHWVQKNVVNPVARLGVQLGLAPRHFALLETKGRKTGRRRQTPVGGAMLGPAFWVVAVHGADSAYVKNLMAEPAVRVKVRRSWYSGRATVVPDDDPLERHHQIVAANGWVGRADGVFFRAAATKPVSVRVDLDWLAPSLSGGAISERARRSGPPPGPLP